MQPVLFLLERNRNSTVRRAVRRCRSLSVSNKTPRLTEIYIDDARRKGAFIEGFRPRNVCIKGSRDAISFVTLIHEVDTGIKRRLIFGSWLRGG